MRISDWSSDVCSSDLLVGVGLAEHLQRLGGEFCLRHLAVTVRVKLREHVASHLAMTHVVAAHYLAVAALAIAPFFSARRVGGVKFGLADLAVQIGRAACRVRVCVYV